MKRILCFGDSNTWGVLPTNGSVSNRHPDDVRWTGVLRRELGEGYQIIEEGLNGRTTVYDDPVEGKMSGVKYFRPCVESQSPLDLIIIMLGSNDLKTRYGLNPRSIALGFGRYLDVLASVPLAGKEPKVLLVSPILMDPAYKKLPLFYDLFGTDADKKSELLADAYREFAEQNKLYYMNAADYGKASVKDGAHMEADSHKRLGLAFAKKVKEIIG